ncbi:hypothetical protein D3C77_363600 [compost metagenome]
MGDDQRFDALDAKAQLLSIRPCLRVSPLLQAAIHQQAAVLIEMELMAGTGDTADGTMV